MSKTAARRGRPLSMYDETTLRINNALARDPAQLGPRLGMCARQCGLSAREIAGLIDASLPTVYRWFFGESEPSRAYRGRALRMLKVMEWAVHTGRIPILGYSPEETALNYREVSTAFAKAQNSPVDVG